MGEVISRFFKKSDTQFKQMDTIQFDDILIEPKNTIFEVADEEKVMEEEPINESPVDVQSLNQALSDSLFNPTNSRPLILYIHDDESLSTQIFTDVILCSETISAYLVEEFVIWNWNLTNENYYELLTIIGRDLGEEIATVIDSTPKDMYPLFVCLIFDRGQIQIECIIDGLMSDTEALSLLIQTRDAFSSRFELPDTTGLPLTHISKENWSIPPSTLTEVEKDSNEFRSVADDFDGAASSIVRIQRIENTVWLLQYLNQKQMVDIRNRHDQTEKLLFHGCPYDAAEQILRQGFDHDRIGRNGSLFGRGFYFSSLRSLSDQYAVPHPRTREKRILMCRVLVGRTCLGSTRITTCPSNYDSTTDRLNIHVIYSNRHVLPEYLITYK